MKVLAFEREIAGAAPDLFRQFAREEAEQA